MTRMFRFVANAASTVCMCGALCAQSPSFVPDLNFTGSALTGWNQIGDAKWSATNGEITGSGTGLLVFNKPAQDQAVYLQFRCEADCNAGIVLRSTKTDGGTKGLMLSIQQQELTG